MSTEAEPEAGAGTSAALEGALTTLAGGARAPEPTDNEADTATAAPPARPEGWQQVEMDPATQQRFNRVYGQMKHMERFTSALVADHKALAERVTELTRAQQASADAALIAQIKDAADHGDLTTVATLTQQRVDAKLSTSTREQQPSAPEQPAEAAVPASSNDIWGQLTPADQQRVIAWAAEKDATGALRRPWFNPEHPRYPSVLRHLQGVLADFDDGTVSDIAEGMSRLDALMGMERASGPRPQPAVLPGGGQRPPRPAQRLSPEQREIALALYGNLDEKDALKRYETALGAAGLEPGKTTERRTWARTFK